MPSPEHPTDRKEKILTDSPFLRTFIGGNPLSELWPIDLESAFEPIDQEIEIVAGSDWKTFTTLPLFLVANSHDIFNKSLSTEERCGTVNTVVGIGFEVGNYPDCELFLIEICTRLRDISALDPLMLIDQSSREKVVDSVIGLLRVGVFLNHNKKANVDSPFTDFIDSQLDLD